MNKIETYLHAQIGMYLHAKNRNVFTWVNSKRIFMSKIKKYFHSQNRNVFRWAKSKRSRSRYIYISKIETYMYIRNVPERLQRHDIGFETPYVWQNIPERLWNVPERLQRHDIGFETPHVWPFSLQPFVNVWRNEAV
jgi:hypothetical protein